MHTGLNEGEKELDRMLSRLLPNPKYLKNHTRRISNPNTCLDPPTPNCSCSRLIKWIVYKKMGSEWGSLIKKSDWCRVVSSVYPRESAHISWPCRKRERANGQSLTGLLTQLLCRTIKTLIIELYCIMCRKNSASLVSFLPLSLSFTFQRVKNEKKRNVFCISLYSHEWRPNERWRK